MSSLEKKLQQAVEDGKVPHAIVAATNAAGTFTYNRAVGHSGITAARPITEDAELQICSSSKLMTSIAGLQIIEKGLIGLDEDVCPHLPELAAKPVLKGFDSDDNPILEKRQKIITLRHMLTHSSGITYVEMDKKIIKFAKLNGGPSGYETTVLERYDLPLLFEPGEGWIYGSNMDWTGRLIERLTGLSLEEYMKKNIWEPLGLRTITFWPDCDEALKSKIPILTVRTPEGSLAPYTGPFINIGSKDCFGGHGLFGTMADYLKVQRSILANDGKLLQPRSVDMMFSPHLSAAAKKALNEFMKSPSGAYFPGNHDKEVEVDFGLGSMIFLEPHEGRRMKGTLHWGGLANTFWIIDREADLALTFGTQVIPPGDKMVGETIKAVELAIYKMFREQLKL